VDDHFLLETTIVGSRNALVLLGLLGSLLAVVREFIPPDDKVIEPNKTMLDIATHTHYLPDEWVNKAHTPPVQNEFFSLFRYKAQLWLNEAFGIIFAPIIMIFFLPRNAEGIIQFFRDYTVEKTELPMCRFASFDMELGNKDYLPKITKPHEPEPTIPIPNPLPVEEPILPYSDPDKLPKRTTSLALTGTQSIPTLFKDVQRRKKPYDVIIPMPEDDDEDDKDKKKSKKKEKKKDHRIDRDQDILMNRDDHLIPLHSSGELIDFGSSGPVKPSKYGKMELSIINFKSNYPKWAPLDQQRHDIDQFLNEVTSSSLDLTYLALRSTDSLESSVYGYYSSLNHDSVTLQKS